VEDAHVDPSRPIPLVVYQAPSVTRSLGIQALDRVGLSHRITCTIRGVNGLLAATRAGLGVAIFAQSLTPDDLVELPAEAQLPELGELDLVLLTGPRAPTEAANALITAIMSRAWVRTRTAA
jgi:DNA-binding transcriptional LysR family regulator